MGRFMEAVKKRNRHWNRIRDLPTHAARMRAWRKNNPRAAKNADLKKAYGIAVDEYERMAARQNGRCAICKELPSRKALAVDHCHKSGMLRGLLCDTCNRALGLLKESPLVLQAAIEYVKEFAWLA